MKPCSACGKAPRKVSRSGETLPYCADCQRDKWRAAKAKQQGRAIPATKSKAEAISFIQERVNAARERQAIKASIKPYQGGGQ